MLNDLMLNEIHELQQEHTGFKVTDLESATWAFRKKKCVEEQRAEFKALAEKEIERIRNWYNQENLKLDGQEAYFDGLLYEYALQQRKENPKWKLTSPYGKISFRKQPAKWNIEDEILLHNLKSSGLNNLIRVKEEINKAELKKVAIVVNGNVLIDGEIIEGVTVEEQEEAIKIEVAE